MDYREHINQLKDEWIGKKVIYEDELHTVVDVDYNGALLIDKKAQYTETTAVGISQVRLNCAGCKWLDQIQYYANGREERKLPIVRVRFIFCKDSAFPVNTVKNRALSEPGFSDRSITSAYSECCFRQAFVRPSADMPVRRCGAAGLADGMPRPVICCALRGSARPALRCCRP